MYSLGVYLVGYVIILSIQTQFELMKNICYLLVTMFLNENGKTGHQNVYVNVKGGFILSKVANRICQDYGFQKVVVLYRTEVTETEFWANRTANPELCCFVSK
jgi:hypothetical protein